MLQGLENAPEGVVLVTGATGFVGSAVARLLRERGWRVRVFARPNANRANLDPADEVAEGDIRNRDSVARALRGVRHLIHVAADYRLWARDPSEIYRTNVDGARIMMEEALEAGVPVAPVVVNDTRLVMRKGSKSVTPGDVWLEILPPVSTQGYTEETIEELIQRVRNAIVPRVRTD